MSLFCDRVGDWMSQCPPREHQRLEGQDRDLDAQQDRVGQPDRVHRVQGETAPGWEVRILQRLVA